MAFTRVCGLNDVPVDTMDSYLVDDVEVLVVHGSSGVHAFDGICPHGGISTGGRLLRRLHDCLYRSRVDLRRRDRTSGVPARVSSYRVSPQDSGQRDLCRRRLGGTGLRIRLTRRHGFWDPEISRAIARTGKDAALPRASSKTADVIFDLVSLLLRVARPADGEQSAGCASAACRRPCRRRGDASRRCRWPTRAE